MKKYIKLQKHEELADGDECRYVYSEEWRPNVHRSQMVGFEYRRPVPHTGDVQFLMAVSVLVPVIINCDGREQESIEAEAGEIAYQKVLDDPRKYINYESIDWANCKVDEIQPEPQNPGKYRYLTKHDIIEKSDEYLFPDGWKPVPMVMYGDQFNEECDNHSIRRPITEPQYRPFVEGEVVEAGDQQLHGGKWVDFHHTWLGLGANSVISRGNTVRKLIK